MLKVKLVINFLAGKLQKNQLNIKKILKKLSDCQIISEVSITTFDRQDKHLIMNDLDKKDAMIVVGGDGTLNKVITYMIEDSIYCPILFIPAGTANVFALEKKLTSNIDRAINILLSGNKSKIDIGFVKHSDGINYFLLMVGIGIDSKAVKEVDVNIKKLLGKTSYLFAGLKNFITYKAKQIEVELENEIIPDVHTVIISNSRLYGGNMELFPDANMHDGLLDMCIFRANSNIALLKNIVNIQYGKHIAQPFVNYLKTDLLKNIINIQYGKHISQPFVNYLKTDSAIIKSIDNKKMPFHLDGEFIGYLPVEIGILKAKIEFFLP